MPGAVRVATKWLISLYKRPNLKHHYITSTKQKDRQLARVPYNNNNNNNNF